LEVYLISVYSGKEASMKNKNENLNSQDSSFPLFTEETEFSSRLPSVYSPPKLSVKKSKGRFPISLSTDVNMTIRLKVSEFSRKQATILAGQALFEVAQSGISLGEWMILEFLYSYLLGNKLDPFELKNPKEFEISLLLKVILSSVSWIDPEGYEQLPQEILSLIEKSPWVPSLRTYSSRKSLFSLERFLVVRFVPIDNLIERNKGTLRYSSYCKGYGESRQTGRCKKTRFSAELDGEPVNLENESLIKLPLQKIERILQLTMLEIKYTFQKRR
jgi:hypothetical protein